MPDPASPPTPDELAALPDGAHLRRGDAIARYVLVPLLVAFLGIVLVFYVLFNARAVDGPSMLPTLRSQDRLLVTKGYDAPQRGDIVVATLEGQNGVPETVVKRVIAIGGDNVEIVDDHAIVNGQPEQTTGAVFAGSGVSRRSITLKPDELYLMGDNRAVSWDSRFVGPVALSAATGRAVAIFSPITRVRLIPR